MARSTQEEIISLLWLIAALLAFIAGFNTASGVFIAVAIINIIMTILFLFSEWRKK